MTQRYLVHDEPVSGPATHAIVFGVGTYPHLNGGSGMLTPDHDGMGQLSSPPISAHEFAAWLIGSFNHPSKPLSTVALLVSATAPEKFKNPRSSKLYDVEPATSEISTQLD